MSYVGQINELYSEETFARIMASKVYTDTQDNFDIAEHIIALEIGKLKSN